MIVLDTNVLSELIRPAPTPGVVQWVDSHESSDLVTTAITAAELRAGVAQLPSGQRRSRIRVQVEQLLAETFAGYVLSLDVDSSEHYADIVSARRRAGASISGLDAQIAAICRQYQSSLATRNVKDFAAIGIQVINPWAPAS